jgi:hypothetical protein
MKSTQDRTRYMKVFTKDNELKETIVFYNSVLSSMSKGDALQVNEKEHCNLTELMSFYKSVRVKVSQLYEKCVGDDALN